MIYDVHAKRLCKNMHVDRGGGGGGGWGVGGGGVVGEYIVFTHAHFRTCTSP